MTKPAETVRGEVAPYQHTKSTKKKITPILPGLALTIAIGIVSWGLGHIMPRLGGVTISIVLGVLAGNLLPNATRYNQGARVAEKQILPIAIALLGVELQLASLVTLGSSAALIILATITTSLGTSLLLGSLFGYSKKFSILIGSGNGICGSSAVAATSQAIKAEETDIGISISVVNLLGTLGIFILPALARLFSLDTNASGLLVGGSLQAVGQVVAAGNILGPEVGLVAIAVKMGRVLMLGPIVVLLGFLSQRKAQKQQLKRTRIDIPLFIVGFFVLSLLASFGVLPNFAIELFVTLGKTLLIVAMAGIGLRIHLHALYKSAPRAMLFGALVSVTQIVALMILISVFVA